MTEIPNSIRSRLQKLLALANDARGNEHETQSAAAKVQALLSEYNLEMSQVVETSGADNGMHVDASREKLDGGIEVEGDWQATIFSAVAENNFCLRVLESWDDKDNTRVFGLIGRRINIMTTLNLYSYLVTTVDRFCPFKDRRTKAFRSWKEGCANRLRERLYEQRMASEAESRARAGEGPRGNGSDLVLSDVYSSEDDLNRDFKLGLEPGTSARERIEREARYQAEAEARRNAPPPTPAPPPVRHETEAQRRKREAKEAADSARWWKQYERKRSIEAAKRDQAAYDMGQGAASQISLNKQIA